MQKKTRGKCAGSKKTDQRVLVYIRIIIIEIPAKIAALIALIILGITES